MVGLALVMVVARGRRLAQRQWLGVPIGMFAHLLLDATWADTDLFWWPVTGCVPRPPSRSPRRGGRWPSSWSSRSSASAVLVGLWVRLGLTEPEHRERFRRTGHLDRERA